MTDETVPAHLQGSYRMLKAAFPEDIDRGDYITLLSLLHDEFSNRNLAELMSHCFGVDYHGALNDVYYVGSPEFKRDPEALGRMKQRLIPHGYLEWLKEE